MRHSWRGLSREEWLDKARPQVLYLPQIRKRYIRGVASSGAVGGDVTQPSGLTDVLLQVSETDLAQATTARKTKALVQASETDLAQTVTPRRTRALVQAIETDLAQAFSVRKTRLLAQVVEIELAQAITPRKTKAIGQPAETDLAQPLGPVQKTRQLGQASELDEATALVTVAVAVGSAGMLYTWNGLSIEQWSDIASTSAGLVDVPQVRKRWIRDGSFVELLAGDVSHPAQFAALEQALEFDVAQPIRPVIQPAREIDLAFAITPRKSKTLGQPLETDLAQAIKRLKFKLLDQASETDTAQALTAIGGGPPPTGALHERMRTGVGN
jgi:hypothetical protein